MFSKFLIKKNKVLKNIVNLHFQQNASIPCTKPIKQSQIQTQISCKSLKIK